MKISTILLVALSLTVGVVLLFAIAVPVVPHSKPFNFSRSLPTGSSYFNGAPDCGPNETIRAYFPSPGLISYQITQNDSDATVDVWWVSANTQSFQSTGFGGGTGTMSSGDYTITFKGCGPTPTVSIGLWGTVNYTTPLL
jgi:hypothetical protein